MIQITPHMRILVAVEPIDFRAGIDVRRDNQDEKSASIKMRKMVRAGGCRA